MTALPTASQRLSRWDYVALSTLVAFTALYLYRRAEWSSVPMEDSLMLLRYAQHLAEGHGIRWNVGERPVEGATDFLYMVSVAAASRITHLGAILSARLLLAVAHLASVGVLYAGARKLFGWPIHSSLCLALYLAVGVARGYISTGFGAPFYAFFALAAWYVALACLRFGATARRGAWLGGFLLLTALTRPEGVFMAAFILLALYVGLGAASLRAVLPAAGFLAVLGLVYFGWRWHYFGYLLPNPFYLKGGGHLYPGSLSASLRNVRDMLLPLLPVFVVELFSGGYKRAIVAAIPTLGFACIWVLLSDENNALMRFQYCAVPIALLSLPYASSTARAWLAGLMPRPIAQAALVATALVVSVAYWTKIYAVPPVGSGPYDIASQLLPFRDRDYVLATTEAGAFPYFSQWRAVDLYGLNDPSIVHNPHRLTEEYLERRNPAIVIFHQLPPEMLWPSFRQVLGVTRTFVATHPYELAASWGDTLCSREYFYVRKGLPETQQFLTMIRQARPFFLDTGAVSYNFGDTPMPDTCLDTAVRLHSSQ